MITSNKKLKKKMGGCQSDSVVEVSGRPRREGSQEKVYDNDLGPDPNFPDMKEWKGNRYKGIGIKRMKGYKCSLTIDKLNKKREEFWKYKCDRSYMWQVVQQACVYDEVRANMVLEKYHLRCADGCINHIIDENGNHYYVPNYCINDPYFEKTLYEDEKDDEETLNLVLFEVSQNITKTITISNHATGEELKKKFRKAAKIKKSKFTLRLFFSGCEIKDDHYLYQHKLENDYKIQVMKIPVNNSDE